MTKVILGLLVLAGGSYLIFFSGDKKDRIENNLEKIEESSVLDNYENENSVTQPDSFEEKTTLSMLMDKGGNYECTFSHKTQVGESTGVVYISGKKIRGDFVSKVSLPGMGDMGNINTFMISDGESVYTWTSMSKEGYKVPQSEQNKTSQSDTSIPTNQELDYKCISWKVDNQKFSLPTNITFKTF